MRPLLARGRFTNRAIHECGKVSTLGKLIGSLTTIFAQYFLNWWCNHMLVIITEDQEG